MITIDILERICISIVSSLYQYAPASIIMAILFMFAYRNIEKKGIRAVALEWITDFKNFTEFRRIFVLTIYTCLILYRTILCRQIWGNPIGNILGEWSFHYSDGTLSTELFENILLFIPFSFLMLRTFQDKILHGKIGFKSICWNTIRVSFVFSLNIEICQILFRVGTFQISDLITNTLGGAIGGVVYWIEYRVKYRK